MEARKLLYLAMAFAPVLLMAGIGVHARTYEDPFDWPSTQPDQIRINAYLPLVIETLDSLDRNKISNEAEVRRLAGRWIEGAQSGKLKPLVPVSADELISSANKTKIFESTGLVSRRLIIYADSHIEAGQFREAARNLVLASDCLQAVKYSSFMSLFRVSLVQSNILRRIETIYPGLDRKTRSLVADGMDRMKGDRAEFEAIARRAKVVIGEYLRLHTGTDEDVQTAADFVPASSFFEQSALAKVSVETVQMGVDQSDFMFPNQKIEAAQCMLTDERNRLAIQKIVSLSDSPKQF